MAPYSQLGKTRNISSVQYNTDIAITGRLVIHLNPPLKYYIL